MVKIAVIHEAPQPTLSSRQLILALINEGVDAYYLRISKIHGFVTNSGFELRYGSNVKLELDGAFVRNLGFILSTEQLLKRVSILRQMELNNVTLVNPVEGMLLARDKYMSVLTLKKHGLPVPDTAVVEDVFTATQLVKEWGEVVIKPLVGSMGFGSIKTSDPDIAFRVAKTLLNLGQPIYIQKYVEKPGRDIRVFVVGDDVLGGMYRISPAHSWKTNVAQGAKVKALKVNEELRELAIKATKALGLHYSGVDIGEGKGGYVIFEVNASPLWAGFMRATGINPAPHLVKHILSLVKR